MKFVEINYLLFLLGIENDTRKVCEFFFSRQGIVFDTRFFCGVLGFEPIIIPITPIALNSLSSLNSLLPLTTLTTLTTLLVSLTCRASLCDYRSA